MAQLQSAVPVSWVLEPRIAWQWQEVLAPCSKMSSKASPRAAPTKDPRMASSRFAAATLAAVLGVPFERSRRFGHTVSMSSWARLRQLGRNEAAATSRRVRGRGNDIIAVGPPEVGYDDTKVKAKEDHPAEDVDKDGYVKRKRPTRPTTWPDPIQHMAVTEEDLKSMRQTQTKKMSAKEKAAEILAKLEEERKLPEYSHRGKMNKYDEYYKKKQKEAEEEAAALEANGGIREKVMPEEIFRKRLEDHQKMRWDIKELSDEEARLYSKVKRLLQPLVEERSKHWQTDDTMEEKKEGAFQAAIEWEEHLDKEYGHNPWSFMAKSTDEEKELYSRITTNDANEKARAREKRDLDRTRIGDDIGTGTPAPNVYVDIPPRPLPWEGGLEKEALNNVIHEALGISRDQASHLIRLGAVWVYESYTRQWERVKKNELVPPEQDVRVFPNPERFHTCYVKDWRDRVKFVDQDFVIVDKPQLLPCFAKVANGRESLSQCLREGLHLRSWGDDTNRITDELKACNSLDDEATGLVALSRHPEANEKFDEWMQNKEVVFEFVALTTKILPKRRYRHFFMKSACRQGQPKPALYEEIPKHMISSGSSYQNWDICEMEVVATHELANGSAAMRIRTWNTGYKERIRAQLAHLGAPVFNDAAFGATGIQMSEQVAKSSGIVAGDSEHYRIDGEDSMAPGAKAWSTSVLSGAVDEETLRSSYGYKLKLLEPAREAAAHGVPQNYMKKAPVALHLARVDFKGRVVTSAPPPYWPEGAAAAVAVKLTEGDIETNVKAFLVTQGGYARFGSVSGRFLGLNKVWFEEHFPIDPVAGLVFASEDSKFEWMCSQRVKRGRLAYTPKQRLGRETRAWRKFRVKEKYLKPTEWHKKNPRWKKIRKGLVKPVLNW